MFTAIEMVECCVTVIDKGDGIPEPIREEMPGWVRNDLGAV